MAEKQKSPTISVVSAIAPSVESVRGAALRYDALQLAVEQRTHNEQNLQAEVWQSEVGSLEEEQKARQLAEQYLLMGSLALSQAQTPESKRVWSERYT